MKQRAYRKLTRREKTSIGKKIRLLRHEGYPQKQAIAVAMRMKGVKRPVGRSVESHNERVLTYARIVISKLVSKFQFSSDEAEQAVIRWGQLVRTSWAAARKPETVAREIYRYETGGPPNPRSAENKPKGTYLGPLLWGHGDEAEELRRRAFSWVSRIGAAPKFGSRPIGWYQNHVVAAIEIIEAQARREAGHAEGFYKTQGGTIRFQVSGQGPWLNLGISGHDVYEQADRRTRGGQHL